jgi:hypothetical protein
MIKVYKLISGEELIGEVFNVLGDSVELKNPATIVIQQTQKGMGVGLAPYMPYAEEEKIFLRYSAIASEATPAVNMVNEYSRIFGSGIQIAPAGSVFTG